MRRATVKLLLLDPEDHVLLIEAIDPPTGRRCWYPVGGGIERGESLQDAAEREAHEETGLASLPTGTRIWTREHTYRYDGRTMDVHEDWLLHRVAHFDPAPAGLSDRETRTVRGFRWWTADELSTTGDVVLPPTLGILMADLLRVGPPDVPIDISDASAP